MPSTPKQTPSSRYGTPSTPRTPEEIKKEDELKKNRARFKHHWRIDMLAIPKGRGDELEMFKMSDKERDEYVEKKHAVVELEIKKSKPKVPYSQDEAKQKRIQELSFPPIRVLAMQKKEHRELGKVFEDRMDNQIKASYETRYNQYKMARVKLSKKKSKTKPAKSQMKAKQKRGKSKDTKKSKKSKEEKLKEAIEWCGKNAKPKKIFPPPKINRGKRRDINVNRLSKLATPRHMYVRPSQLSINNLWKIKRNALTYRATSRIGELATATPREVEEGLGPGEVVPAALTAVPTPRVLELAVPRPRAAAKEADFNEDAFKISPNALKYVATPRILELAKPLERD